MPVDVGIDIQQLRADVIDWLEANTNLPRRVLVARNGYTEGPFPVSELVENSEARRQFMRRVPHRVRAHDRQGHPVRAHTRRGQGTLKVPGLALFPKAFWARPRGQFVALRRLGLGGLERVFYRLDQGTLTRLKEFIAKRTEELTSVTEANRG